MRSFLFTFLVIGFAFTSAKNLFKKPFKERINGVNFVAPIKELNPSCFKPIYNIGARWIAFVPFAYGKFNWEKLSFDNDWQWRGETSEGIKKCISAAKNKGFKVMIKPQIWFKGGSYTGDFILDNDVKWKVFENDYEDYILSYAKICEAQKVEIFCIGTELKSFVKMRPKFWFNLIEKCRKVFKGKLIYAGNWDSYQEFKYWEKLDYIGIDSYFPLSNERVPTLDSLKEGWKRHVFSISNFSKKKNKQIVFTEFGYRSIDFCAKFPWDSSSGYSINLEAQSIAFEAVFQNFWNKEWFAGGFIWKWHSKNKTAGGLNNNRFTPQNKPAMDVIKKYYCKNNCP